MAFYSDFAGHYEKIFPFRSGVFEFLDGWLPTQGRILDIGCGTGRYCGALERTGRRCLGLDLDPGMINEAQRLNPGSQFQILGMEDLELLAEGEFSGVFCIGNVLPHLPADRYVDFLRNIRRLLHPGGIWVFQTVNFDPLLHVTQYDFPPIHLKKERLIFHRSYSDIRPDRLMFNTRLEGPDGEIFSGEVPLYPRTSVDYQTSHRSEGFTRLGRFADFSGRGFHPQDSSGNVQIWMRNEDQDEED